MPRDTTRLQHPDRQNRRDPYPAGRVVPGLVRADQRDLRASDPPFHGQSRPHGRDGRGALHPGGADLLRLPPASRTRPQHHRSSLRSDSRQHHPLSPGGRLADHGGIEVRFAGVRDRHRGSAHERGAGRPLLRPLLPHGIREQPACRGDPVARLHQSHAGHLQHAAGLPPRWWAGLPRHDLGRDAIPHPRHPLRRQGWATRGCRTRDRRRRHPRDRHRRRHRRPERALADHDRWFPLQRRRAEPCDSGRGGAAGERHGA